MERRKGVLRAVVFVCAGLLAAAGCYSAPEETGPRPDAAWSDAAAVDGDMPDEGAPDGGGVLDSGGGGEDAGGGADGEIEDALGTDAGETSDSAGGDAQSDVGTDAGTNPDGAAPDVGVDAGPELDAGADSGPLPDAGADAGVGPGEDVLLEVDGPFFTPSDADLMRRYDVGQNGTVYTRIGLRFDVLAGEYVPQPAGGNRLEHILFGLFRAHRPSSNERYIAGAAAVTFADGKAPHFRMFGRVTIGSGYQTYTSDSGTYRWVSGGNYRMECFLDGVADVQECVLSLDGQEVATRTLSVAYLVPEDHMSTAFWIEIGTDVLNELSATPIGWQFSNLLVTAARK
ncbi:MAG: hypothetical protein HY897_13285 [Deltaproteobacteria bacterium]|nr:hypothetical protein [Deltaproteobacteria bacterium]